MSQNLSLSVASLNRSPAKEEKGEGVCLQRGQLLAIAVVTRQVRPSSIHHKHRGVAHTSCNRFYLFISVYCTGSVKTTRASLMLDLTTTQKKQHEELMKFNVSAQEASNLRHEKFIEYHNQKDEVESTYRVSRTILQEQDSLRTRIE